MHPRGRWRPACFLELARHNPAPDRIGGWGSQFLLKCLRIQWGFLFKISFLPYRGTDLIKIIKWLPDIRHLDPVLDHFGTDTVAIHVNSGFRTQIATVSVPTLFRNRSRWQFAVCYSIDTFQKVPHNQHPAGPVRSPVLVFASSKIRIQGQGNA